MGEPMFYGIKFLKLLSICTEAKFYLGFANDFWATAKHPNKEILVSYCLYGARITPNVSN